jgi:hypothetical protein
MAKIVLLVRNFESGNLTYMVLTESEIERYNITAASLKENGWELVDNHEDALARLYARPRLRPIVAGFRPSAAHLRP